MKKWIYSIAVLTGILYLYGCEKAYIRFGEQVVDAGITNIVVVDTLTPVISTVFRDSVVTSQTGTVLAGSYNDDVFGKISVASFAVLAAPSAVPDMHVSAAYDSLVLQMRGDSSFYGDTTAAQRFYVHQLASVIEFGEGQTKLYDRSDFPVQAAPLGAANISIRPSLKDSVKIRLNDATGKGLFELIQSKSQQVLTDADFEQYFKGIRISPGAGVENTAIYGFSDSITMRLYYHESDPYLTEKHIDFVLTARNKQFNQVHYNRAGTALNQPIPESRELPSELTGQAAYVQPLTGAILKVRFPTLRSLLQRDDYVKIMKADLIIPPLKASYSTKYMLPPQIVASPTTVNNETGGYLGEAGVTGTQGAQYGNLVTDWIYGEDTYYSYDVTAYLQAQVAISADNTNGLLFFPPSPAYTTRFNRLVTGNHQNSAGSVKLKLYYISVQP